MLIEWAESGGKVQLVNKLITSSPGSSRALLMVDLWSRDLPFARVSSKPHFERREDPGDEGAKRATV